MKYLFGILGVVGLILSGAVAAQTAQTGSQNTAVGPAYTAADKAKLATQPTVDSSIESSVETGHAETAVACSRCWTCGGDWPVFAGSSNVVAAPNNVTERGPSCSGAPGSVPLPPGALSGQ